MSALKPSRGRYVRGVQSVARAVAVLRAFSTRAPVLSLSEVARATGLDKGTCRRLLLTLTDAGLVEQDAVTHRYALGLGVLEIGAAVEHGRDLRELARPALGAIARETGATAFLGVQRGGEAVCLERVDGSDQVQVRAWMVGGRLPLNCGAGPRVLFAHLPPAEIDRVVRAGLRALTAKSQTDGAALRRELARIRRRGWELAVDDIALGLAAIGVPIRNARGDVVAAISIAGLTPHLVDNRRPRFLPSLLREAAELATRLR